MHQERMKRYPAEHTSRRKLLITGAMLAALGIGVDLWGQDALYFVFPELIDSPQEQVISLDMRGSYTFISVGDSLAAGLEGINNPDNIPESWVGPMVNKLNMTRRKNEQFYAGSSTIYSEWQYKENSLLAKPGLSSSNLLKIMQQPNAMQLLSDPYQAVLCLSIGFNDIYDLKNASVFDLLTLHNKMDTYQENVEKVIKLFKQARASKESNPACMLLGLPNLDEVPVVAQTLRRTPLAGKAQLFAKEINQRLATICHNIPGVACGYVDLFNNQSISPSLISVFDGLHPNADGYEQMGAIAAQTVHIRVSN